MTDDPRPRTRLSRAVQMKLLTIMAEQYPELVRTVPDIEGYDHAAVVAHIIHLSSVGLCQAIVASGIGMAASEGPSIGGMRITAAGLQFLDADAGVGAELEVLTIKIHTDSLRAIMAARVDAAPLPASEKADLKHRIAALSDRAVQAATGDLVRAALDRLPDAIHMLRTLAGL